MARTFGGGSTDNVLIGQHTAINSLTQFTLALWTYRTGEGGNNLGRMLDKVGLFTLYTDNPSYTDCYEFIARQWGTDGVWTFTRPAASQWHHIALTYDYSSTSNHPLAYVDGVAVATTRRTTPATGGGAETTDLYIGNASAANRVWAGSLAEVGYWSRILSPGEIFAIGARGRRPSEIFDRLLLYMPLYGGVGPERSEVGIYTGTVTGTVQAAHPPVVTPPRKRGVYISVPGAAPGVTIPRIEQYYRRLRGAA